MRCCGSGSSGRQHIEFVALGVRKDHPGRGALPTIDATRSHAQEPFDLSCGPLIRVKVLRLSDEEHLLLLTLHHIITDGWSIAVLMQELVTLYQGYASGSSTTFKRVRKSSLPGSMYRMPVANSPRRAVS